MIISQKGTKVNRKVIKMIKNLERKNVTERIKKLIEKKGITRKELEEKTGIKKTAIHNYLVENKLPGTEALYKIAQVLGVSIEYLLTGETTELNEKEKKLLEDYRNSPKNIQEIVDKTLALNKKNNSVQASNLETIKKTS